jgi:nitroimidazol reductase NimA-like FMN-containing flavoprotein (pyridoxamine 5'-phosphate oxidase superfamily)
VLVEEMTAEDCRKVMSSAAFGRLGSVQDGQPYVVPVSFAADREYAYLFSMPGRKVDSMRKNPRVCLEVDRVSSQTLWMSIVVLGRYEELPDTPESRPDRMRAQELLSGHPSWWLPGAVTEADRAPENAQPIFYRIYMEHLTGRRSVPAPDEAAVTVSSGPSARSSVTRRG